jgi:hypothetical protein
MVGVIFDSSALITCNKPPPVSDAIVEIVVHVVRTVKSQDQGSRQKKSKQKKPYRIPFLSSTDLTRRV